MLTRSKIKMQESIRQVHHDLPYFNNEEEPAQAYYYKQSKNQSKVTQNYSQHSLQHQQAPFKNDYYEYAAETTTKGYGSRNEILKELRQQYEILKNLSIEDSMPSYGKKYDQKELYGHSESSLSSSVHSKKSNRIKQSAVTSPKMSSKEVQSLHLEKKQLQIVIGNSMRKIQELLNNEILLKKTIHELKNQLEGKGGVHQQYEKAIRSFQKNEDELQGQLNKSKSQNQKCLLKIKDLNEKIRLFQNQLSSKEREIKVGFQEQKKLHELLRLQKDKYMNLQIQCKSYKMEFDLLQKEKNNEINRLIRQFQSKEGGNEKQMAYIIRKLQQDLKEKDRKYHELLLSKDQIKIERQPDVSKPDKNYLQELLYKSREMNDYNSKALNDSMNMIFSKMAEIQRKNEDNLKREIDQLKKKSDDNKKNTNESDLLARITELEKMIAREVSQKNRLAEDIKSMKSHKYELQDKNKQLEKKLLSLQERQDELKEEIAELEEIKNQYNNTYNDHKNLQGQLSNYVQRIRILESEIQAHRTYVNTLNSGFKDKEKRYEDEIRVLKRKVDEAEFETEKVRKEAEFNLNVLRSTHQHQAKKIVQENGKVNQKLTDTSEQIKIIKQQWLVKLQAKESELLIVRTQLQNLKAKAQQDLNGQKIYYDERISSYEIKNNQNIKIWNQKILAITATNDRLMAQIVGYTQMENELIQMRRLLKQTRTMNSSISHLWEIKEVEYDNINQVLKNLRTA